MMKKVFVLFFLTFLFITGTAQNSWVKRESVGGSKRERAVSFSIGNRGYVGLGQDTLNLMMNDFWEFDPATNSWTQRANFAGQARRDAISFVIGNKGYVGTGKNHADSWVGTTLSDFYEYDPITNTWTAKASYPGNSGAGIYYATGFALLGKGYIACGKRGASSYSNELWQYNPVTNTWTARAPYSGVARYGATAFVIGNYAYVGTGCDENIFLQDFWRYNPTTNSWSSMASFPGSGRFACSAFTLNNNGYVVFGTDGGYKDELWQYDPGLDYWVVKASLPGGERKSAFAFTIGSKAYAGTGKSYTGVRRDLYEYTPTPIVGINEMTDGITSIYPIPMVHTGTVILSKHLLSYHKLTWKLLSIDGKVLQSDLVSDNQIFLQRNDLPSGIYFFTLNSGDKIIASKKLIIQ
jgi:N-acetylneuraminic acid mutarotase